MTPIEEQPFFRSETEREKYMKTKTFPTPKQLDLKLLRQCRNEIHVTDVQIHMLHDWKVEKRTTLSMYGLLRSWVGELQCTYGYGFNKLSDEEALCYFLNAAYV